MLRWCVLRRGRFVWISLSGDITVSKGFAGLPVHQFVNANDKADAGAVIYTDALGQVLDADKLAISLLEGPKLGAVLAKFVAEPLNDLGLGRGLLAVLTKLFAHGVAEVKNVRYEAQR